VYAHLFTIKTLHSRRFACSSMLRSLNCKELQTIQRIVVPTFSGSGGPRSDMALRSFGKSITTYPSTGYNILEDLNLRLCYKYVSKGEALNRGITVRQWHNDVENVYWTQSVLHFRAQFSLWLVPNELNLKYVRNCPILKNQYWNESTKFKGQKQNLMKSRSSALNYRMRTDRQIWPC
jgi:hypothetical protein